MLGTSNRSTVVRLRLGLSKETVAEPGELAQPKRRKVWRGSLAWFERAEHHVLTTWGAHHGGRFQNDRGSKRAS